MTITQEDLEAARRENEAASKAAKDRYDALVREEFDKSRKKMDADIVEFRGKYEALIKRRNAEIARAVIAFFVGNDNLRTKKSTVIIQSGIANNFEDIVCAIGNAIKHDIRDAWLDPAAHAVAKVLLAPRDSIFAGLKTARIEEYHEKTRDVTIAFDAPGEKATFIQRLEREFERLSSEQ